MLGFRFARGWRHGEFGPFGDRGRERSWEEGWREWGGFGSGGRKGPRVDRGDVKYLILSVLQDGPKHGYEIMRALEDKSEGAYVPSAGTIYPTLQMLEDMAYVKGVEAEGRKVFTLTDAGRAYLATGQEKAKTAWGRFGDHHGRGSWFGNDEQRQLRDELIALARSLFAEGRILRANATTLTRVRDILKNTRQQIDSALAEYV